MAESIACVCSFWRLYFLLVPSLGRTVMSRVESFLLGSGRFSCDTMTDVRSQGTAQKACMRGTWLSV